MISNETMLPGPERGNAFDCTPPNEVIPVVIVTDSVLLSTYDVVWADSLAESSSDMASKDMYLIYCLIGYENSSSQTSLWLVCDPPKISSPPGPALIVRV